MEEDEKTANQSKSSDRPWLFQPGKSGNPSGKPKGTVSLKTFARKYIQSLSDKEKLEFMKGLPKELIWKMSEGNPKQDIGGGEGEDGKEKPILVKFID